MIMNFRDELSEGILTPVERQIAGIMRSMNTFTEMKSRTFVSKPYGTVTTKVVGDGTIATIELSDNGEYAIKKDIKSKFDKLAKKSDGSLTSENGGKLVYTFK